MQTLILIYHSGLYSLYVLDILINDKPTPTVIPPFILNAVEFLSIDRISGAFTKVRQIKIVSVEQDVT